MNKEKNIYSLEIKQQQQQQLLTCWQGMLFWLLWIYNKKGNNKPQSSIIYNK